MMLVFLIIHFTLLVAAIAAVVFGLWSIALIDLLAYFCVAIGLWALRPEKRATLTYEEIVARNAQPLPLKESVLEVIAA